MSQADAAFSDFVGADTTVLTDFVYADLNTF